MHETTISLEIYNLLEEERQVIEERQVDEERLLDEERQVQLLHQQPIYFCEDNVAALVQQCELAVNRSHTIRIARTDRFRGFLGGHIENQVCRRIEQVDQPVDGCDVVHDVTQNY